MTLETKRLILRPWEKTDAESLYKYAKDEKVGPAAGWPPHESVENSLWVIENILSEEGTFAVVLKETNEPVGSVGIMRGKASNLGIPDTEGEIGYWLGTPYWGRGLIPEAVRELIRYSSQELHLEKIWCAHFEGNEKSKRCMEKCGFKYHHTNENIHWALMDKYYNELVYLLEE